MSSTHEVVTIQVGHYSNFIGTHWWNLQEASFCYTEDSATALDIDHGVLFREGLNPQREITFTPRLIAIDTKNSLKSLKKEGVLYDSGAGDSEDLLWEGSSSVIQQEPKEKNTFLKSLDVNFGNSQENSKGSTAVNLDKDVEVWSDYLKACLHPRSLCLIDEHCISGNESSFKTYGSGLEAYKIKETKEMIEDHLRQYVEECDYLQGFHLIADGDNGFSAVSNSLLEHLNDEYRGKTKIAFPVFQRFKRNVTDVEDLEDSLHCLHSTIFGFSHLNDVTSYFSPLSLASDLTAFKPSPVQFPQLNYKPQLRYHSSAILATALESLTAPYRLRRRKFLLSEVADTIVLYGRKLLSAGICLPFSLQDGKCFTSVLENPSKDYSIRPVTPWFQPQSRNTLAQLAVLRGIPEKRFGRLKSSPEDLDKESLFGQYLSANSPSSLTSACIFDERCAVSMPFPNIFAKNNMQSPNNAGVAVAATLSNSNSALDLIDELHTKSKKYHIKMRLMSSRYEVEQDDFTEVLQTLVALKENYGPDFCV